MEDMSERVRRAAALARTSVLDTFVADPNVVGGGFGRRNVGGERTDEPACVIYVVRKLPPDELPDGAMLPRRAEFEGLSVAVDVVQSGPFEAQQFTARERPAPCGVSVGHPEVTAGTLGCLVRNRREGTFGLLSNNHVLANENEAEEGDLTLQPGPADGGSAARDAIATLKRFVSLDFSPGAVNSVDCAVAEVADEGSVTPRMKDELMPPPAPDHPAVGLLFAGSPERTLLNPIDEALSRLEVELLEGPAAVAEATFDMEVEKVGRTTEHTRGLVTEIDVTAQVRYSRRELTFAGQVAATSMSAAGDSGSLVARRSTAP
jgi:hypothetical protein